MTPGTTTTITDNTDNYILTGTGTANTIQGESKVTFNDTTLYINGALGVGSATPTTIGLIHATNDIVAYSTSDRRLKENVILIPNALSKVLKLSGNTFDWKELKEEEIVTIHGHSGRDVGVIAQEVEIVLPEAVSTRENGYKAVNYDKLIPLLIEAIKEQQIEIEELKRRINE